MLGESGSLPWKLRGTRESVRQMRHVSNSLVAFSSNESLTYIYARQSYFPWSDLFISTLGEIAVIAQIWLSLPSMQIVLELDNGTWIWGVGEDVEVGGGGGGGGNGPGFWHSTSTPKW